MKKVIIFLASMFIIGGSVFAESEWPKNLDMRDTMKIVDVTEGKEIRGIITSSDAYGNATASYEDGTYELHASFNGLTAPSGDDFYEGWVVQRSPFKFISTWELKLTDGTYTNEFSSTTDYMSYDFYVLTLEPNDGNPAPAAHILEGAVSNQDTMMMSEDTIMKEESMIEKEMTPRQKALKSVIESKLETLDIDMWVLLERVMTFRESLDSRNLSASKKATYMELLDVLIVVLTEKTMMNK